MLLDEKTMKRACIIITSVKTIEYFDLDYGNNFDKVIVSFTEVTDCLAIPFLF